MTTLDKMLQGLANALGASLSTLTTTAKTVVGAINELATAVSGHTSKIGSGSLNTTSQTLIGAVNELAAVAAFIETGTNYVRFGNGVQICWGTATTTSSTITVNYPKSFNSTPVVTATPTSHATYMGYGARASSTTTTLTLSCVSGGSAVAAELQYIAIGKWA